MIKIFEELNSIPGFVGICLYDPNTQSIAKAMPGEYSAKDLLDTGHRLVELYQAAGADFGVLHDLLLYETDRMFLLEKITHKAYVYVLAEPHTNVCLLRIALKLLRDPLVQQFQITGQA